MAGQVKNDLCTSIPETAACVRGQQFGRHSVEDGLTVIVYAVPSVEKAPPISPPSIVPTGVPVPTEIPHAIGMRVQYALCTIYMKMLPHRIGFAIQAVCF